MKYILINLYSFLKFIWMFFYNSFCELLRSFKAVGLQIQNLEIFRLRQAYVKVCQTSRIVCKSLSNFQNCFPDILVTLCEINMPNSQKIASIQKICPLPYKIIANTSHCRCARLLNHDAASNNIIRNQIELEIKFLPRKKENFSL